MSYIVCRNCKKYFEVDDNIPLNFDKCENCGHTLEFAGNQRELAMVLNDIIIPDISYEKTCTSCGESNPREAPYCLKCGKQDFQYQYDMEQINNEENKNVKTVVINVGFPPKNSIANNIILRIITLIMGLVDFFFFSILGIQFILGGTSLPDDLMLFATQNMYSLASICILSLLLSGILSVLMLPKMNYLETVQITSTIGIVVGLTTLLVTNSLSTIIISVIICGILSSIGGVIGEFIIHKFTNRT